MLITFTEIEINKINLAKHKEDSKKGVILEVDVEYPQELLDLHKDYPLAGVSNRRPRPYDPHDPDPATLYPRPYDPAHDPTTLSMTLRP